MGRPRKELSPIRDVILTAFQSNVGVDEICALLANDYDINVSRRTLNARLREWKEPPHQQRTQPTSELKDLVHEEFFQRHSSDNEIIAYVSTLGIPISKGGLARLRKDLGLYRRTTEAQRDALVQEAVEFMQTPSLSSVLIPRLGRRSLWKHIHQVANIPIPMASLYDSFTKMFPREVSERYQVLRRRRSDYTAPGPNYTWCLDAYCKLQDFGFEIYAAIDAYSRFITWFYIGVSALTSRAIFLQYLAVVGQWGFIPMVIRSDRGKETAMVAAAHYWLSLATKAHRRLRPRRNMDGEIDFYIPSGDGGPEVQVPREQMDPDAPLFGPERPFSFTDCWVYGKSTKNQRIESWWSQLAKGRTNFWIKFFGQLRRQDLWSKDRDADQIALLWVYMPQIRFELERFVNEWNHHKIRPQKARPHVHPGVPANLFERPGLDQEAVDCRLPLDPQRWEELNKLGQIDGGSTNQFLPEDVHRLCDEIYKQYDGPQELTAESPYLELYCFMRDELARHEASQSSPKLRLLERPVGGWEAFEDKLAQAGVSRVGDK